MHTRCKRIKTCAERKKGGGTSQPTNQHRDLLQQLLLLQRRPVPPAASAIIATAPAAMTEENERVKERKKERIPGIISSSRSPSSHYSYFHLLTPHPDPWLDWGNWNPMEECFLFTLTSIIHYLYSYH